MGSCCTSDNAIDRRSLIGTRPISVQPTQKTTMSRKLIGIIVGEWVGKSKTAEGESQRQKISIEDNKRPLFAYSSQLWKDEKRGKLIHSENGYIRFPSNMEVDLMVSKTSGITEISAGNIFFDEEDKGTSKTRPLEDKNWTLTLLSNSIFGKQNENQTKRIYKYNGIKDELSYQVSISEAGTDTFVKHSVGKFRRVIA